MEKRHHRLDIWKDAIQLVEAVYHFPARFPAEERFGLTARIRRAAVRVPSNIAAGVARASRKVYLRFPSMARGALSELETQLVLATRLKLAPRDEALEALVERVFARLNALMKSLAREPGHEV